LGGAPGAGDHTLPAAADQIASSPASIPESKAGLRRVAVGRVLRLQVRLWLALGQGCECRLRRAYDRLAEHDSRRR
jgi:hypothetical protein